METKICSKCYIEKDLADFGKKITNKDGLQSRCKECRKIESKEDKEKNYNRIKGYRVKNRESLSTKNKKWRKNNPCYDKVWKEKNKEKVKIDLKNKVLILDLYLNGMEKITEYMKSSYKKID